MSTTIRKVFEDEEWHLVRLDPTSMGAIIMEITPISERAVWVMSYSNTSKDVGVVVKNGNTLIIDEDVYFRAVGASDKNPKELNISRRTP
jgi:hypothetical protein